MCWPETLLPLSVYPLNHPTTLLTTYVSPTVQSTKEMKMYPECWYSVWTPSPQLPGNRQVGLAHYKRGCLPPSSRAYSCESPVRVDPGGGRGVWGTGGPGGQATARSTAVPNQGIPSPCLMPCVPLTHFPCSRLHWINLKERHISGVHSVEHN